MNNINYSDEQKSRYMSAEAYHICHILVPDKGILMLRIALFVIDFETFVKT